MFKSSTFKITILTYLFLLPVVYFQANLDFWSIALTVLFGSYILARAMRKKMRATYVEKPFHATREFFVFIFGVLNLGIAIAFNRLNPNLGILLVAILAACFNLARGHINALTATTRFLP